MLSEGITKDQKGVNIETNVIYNEECLEGMSERIPDNSIDMILADLPYGTTACKWDSIIPLEPLWEQYKRIVKRDTAIVLTASQPFTSKLINSNIEQFKYCWYWNKKRGTGHLNAKRQPLKSIEEICVFYQNQPTYNPQMRIRDKPRKSKNTNTQEVYGETEENYSGETLEKRYPVTLVTFSKSAQKDFVLHPTQKPVSLFKYLIKTYTNKGDLVLDNVIGSGTTAVAAKALDRKYIGFEQDEEYYEIARERVSEVQKELI